MTIENIATILKKTELPVSYQDFPDENCPPMPYIIFENSETSNTFADGIVIASFVTVTAVLFTAKKSEEVEKNVETVLNEEGIGWTKATEEDDQERCMHITYQFTVIGG